MTAAAVIWLFATPAMAADIGQKNWAENDYQNNAAGPDGWANAMSDGYIRPTGRAMMGAVKRWYDHANCTGRTGGAPNAQTVNYAVPPAALDPGDVFCFWIGPGLTNTGAPTLRVNDSAPQEVLLPGGAAMSGGEMQAGTPVIVTYDGSYFVLLTLPATLIKAMEVLSSRVNSLEVESKAKRHR
jgi:hypothetical protein